eukprot:11481311-Ditylum_brightwellii.AAC.1
MYIKKLPQNLENTSYNHVHSHNFESCVCHYLGNNVHQYAKENKDPLAWKAAEQCLNVFKTYFSIINSTRMMNLLPFKIAFGRCKEINLNHGNE